MSGLFFIQRIARAEDIFTITSIDVGKGDCILIQTGEKKNPVNVLIDTGYKETADDVLNYLRKQDINKLDALIITHYHKDHVGGAAAILKGVTVDKVYMPDYEGTKKVYEEFMAALAESGGAVPFERLKENKTVTFGDAGYRIYPSTIQFDGSNDNDVSMAISLEYNGHTALFAGDLEGDGIKQLLENSNNNIPENHYDILKFPHHGSDEGEQTAALLKRLKQDGIALITDGQERRAHGTLIDTLKDGFKTYCSTDDGTVIITAEGTNYSVEKSKDPVYKTDGDWKYYVSADGSAVIAGYTGNETDITIPAKVGENPVSSIADSAFYNHTNLKSVTIPEGVRSIGSSAFSWCTSLENVTIPGSVTTIGDAAFSWCKNLTDVTIPDSVTSIGASGFERCTELTNVKLSKALTGIAPSLFEHCRNLTGIEIPAGVKTIGKDAFKRCEKLTDINIPDSVTLIDEGAFKRCERLEKIDIPEGVKTIEDNAFERCIALRSVMIPDSVTTLGKESFMGCAALENAEIGKGVKTIKRSAFFGCTALKSVKLPDSVKTIKENAFRDCTSLKDIYFSGTAREWEAVTKEGDWNNNVPADLEVHCSQEPEPEPEPGPGPEPEPDPDPDLRPGIRFFRMPELPGTGFSARHPQMLDDLPKDLRYEPSGLTLQIPSLDMAEGIVTVPFRDGGYPVEWLGKNIGLPEGFALPGSGRSVLLGHDHLNTAEAGPFALLGMLPENARVIISDKNDRILTYSVFANEKIAADDMAEAERLSASCENSLILITCEDERPEGGYASRRIVAAKPVLTGE